MELSGKRVGILVEQMYNDFEFWYPYYRLKEAGAEVVVVGSGAANAYMSKAGIEAKVDVHAGEAISEEFDGIVIPGGYAPDHMRRYPAMVKLVKDLFEAGKPFGMRLVGLGARDTLRLEMAYSLYGNEISESVSPFEAGLGKAVSLNKGDFIGRDGIIRRGKESRRTLVGLEMLERGIPRPHFALKSDAVVVGSVTSGTMSPCLERGIALAFVQKESSEIGTILDVEIRGRDRSAIVVRTPFWTPRTYRRPRAAPERLTAPGSVPSATA